jgi:ATP-dependent DNA helicase RecG
VDKTRITRIREVNSRSEYVQLAGKIIQMQMAGEKRSKRLTAVFRDDSGEIELTWFQGMHWIEKSLVIGKPYLVFGKVGFFMGRPQITHPEIDPFESVGEGKRAYLEPIYPATEKLKSKGLNGRSIGKLTFTLFTLIKEADVPEMLPDSIISDQHLMSRWDALRSIHFPSTQEEHAAALHRLKFEELFISQLRLGMIRSQRHRFSKGHVFAQVGEYFNTFYQEHLPFALTGAQKRVLKEIRQDTGTGRQMNRLLQGDVGSGKTVVALMTMLLAADNGFQSCLMAPTEILARQHYQSITESLAPMGIPVRILTGSTRSAERKKTLAEVGNGERDILIGTHAVLEDKVQFQNLGLAIIDEQHRFGVVQRAALWKKNIIPPHILVMTATPIPRTLAMTAYGDLDYSVMDELPPGRLPVMTVHRNEDSRPQVMEFIRDEIRKGRQAYIIFPLIEESEKLDYEDLMKGYENVKAWFPEPQYWISMVHGRMPQEQKDVNMQRFVSGETQIMVSTTVIEVGVNVPNASVMVIESAEKFGLSQLHQLRGRVGRGSEKSYCILLTGNKVSNEARGRLSVLCETNDGFKIAEKDLELRGPGEIEGTRQSGALDFMLVNLLEDRELMDVARLEAEKILNADPDLQSDGNRPLRDHLRMASGKTPWSRIS